MTCYFPVKRNDAELLGGIASTLTLCVGIYPRPWAAACQLLARGQRFLRIEPSGGSGDGDRKPSVSLKGGPFSLVETAALTETALAG